MKSSKCPYAQSPYEDVGSREPTGSGLCLQTGGKSVQLAPQEKPTGLITLYSCRDIWSMNQVLTNYLTVP
jgi:hypothetical protein